MTSFPGSLRALASAALALATSAAFAAPPQYHLVPIDIAAAYAISATGDVGGNGVPEEELPAPVVVRAGTRVVLPCPDEGYGDVYGINGAGLAVGTCATDSGPVNTMWGTDDQGVPVGTLGGDLGISWGVNDAGDLAGQSWLPGNLVHHAFVRHDGALQDLGTLGGTNSVAYAINANGVVAGAAEVVPGNARTHAFVYQDGRMTDLGTFGGPGSKATALNIHGHVVGSAEYRGKGHPARAFLWNGHRKIDLGSIGGDSVATGINQHDVVVGQSQRNIHTVPIGWVWIKGSIYRLDDVSDARQQGYAVNDVTGIADDGTIIGWWIDTRDFHAFKLVPIQ